MTPGTLIVIGTGDGVPDQAPGAHPAPAEDLLAAADAVFAGPPEHGPDSDPEAIALFYAEAWRVERIAPRDAAARLDAWFARRPGRTAVLVVAGTVDRAAGLAAAVDGLLRLRPGLRIDRRPAVTLSPPHRSPLAR